MLTCFSKTGVMLKDTGVRDEHGMQPLEDIFSSPEKESQNGADEGEEYEDDSEEEPMDIDNSELLSLPPLALSLDVTINKTGVVATAPAPSAFMNGTRFPPARARSPPKTNLQSPARRPPGMSSSPIRASKVSSGSSPSGGKAVQRKLDFKNNPLANKPALPRPNGVNKGKGKANATTNGYRGSPSEDEEVEEESPQQEEESLAMLDGGDDYGVEDVEEPEEELPEDSEELAAEVQSSPPSAKKSKGRPKKTPAVEPEEPEERIFASIEEDAEPVDEPVRAGKKRGRPAKGKAAADDEPVQKKAKKASRTVNDEEESEPLEQAPAKKVRGRPKAAVASGATEDAPKPAIPKQKRAGKKQASPAIGDTSIAEVPRGPPLPKSRGLVITRRETPGASATFTTRSGRTSFQPLKFWRNERTELEDDAILEDGKQKIMLPKIKEIVRYDDPEPEFKAAGRRKGKAAAKKAGRPRAFQEEEDDDDLEEWERDGNVITGEVVVWQPEHEQNPPGPDEQIEVAADEQIAISANAIQTREIRNATFKFAKVLSTPFFGAGVVDLPPHSEKKPKNARKMQMAFFVFAGRVQVTVADTVFTIGRGGMWFVPRGEQQKKFGWFGRGKQHELTVFEGNYYSIENLTTKPARIFFAQGCEVSSQGVGDISQLA